MASEKITALVEEVKTLTVLELAELVHTLEEVFGNSDRGQLKGLGLLLGSAVSERICLLSTWSVNERPSLFCLCSFSLYSLVAEFTITCA